MRPKSKILIIAGSDSSGGAGIQADIKTVTSLGSYAMTAITAITSQNTTGVQSIFPIKSNEIEKQIIFTCKDIKPDAIKLCMLHSKSVIKSVISSIDKIKVKKIILDPVMVTKSGTKLINNQAIQILKNKLVNKVTLISTGSKTHAQGSESKFTTLEFSKLNNDQLQIEIPEDRNEIQNGTYMLFLINSSGVPSHEEIVNIY